MALAERIGLPAVIHSRDAMKETLDILREFPQVCGVMHCFSGSAETAEEVVRMGWYIGIGGTVTFKNNKKTVAAVKSVPLEKILLETDSPYLARIPTGGREICLCIRELLPQKLVRSRGSPRKKLRRYLWKTPRDCLALIWEDFRKWIILSTGMRAVAVSISI